MKNFIKILFAIGIVFGMQFLSIYLIVESEGLYLSSDRVAYGYGIFSYIIIGSSFIVISFIALFLFKSVFRSNNFRVLLILAIIPCAGFTLFIMHDVAYDGIQYHKKSLAREAERKQLAREQKNIEDNLTRNELPRYITVTQGPVSTTYRDYHYNAEWEIHQYGATYHPERSATRVNGSIVEFYVTNNLKHYSVDFILEVKGKTKHIDDGDFIWSSKSFREKVTVSNLEPGESRKNSVYFDSYVSPRPKHALGVVGSLLAMAAPDSAPIRARQPIDSSTVKFKLTNIKKNN